jgi:hypothetical protein
VSSKGLDQNLAFNVTFRGYNILEVMYISGLRENPGVEVTTFITRTGAGKKTGQGQAEVRIQIVGEKVQDGRQGQGQVRQRSVIQIVGVKVQDGRQGQGQVRQRSVIQIGGEKVQDGRQGQGQVRQRSVIQIVGVKVQDGGKGQGHCRQDWPKQGN